MLPNLGDNAFPARFHVRGGAARATVRELAGLASRESFKGTITDVGGATANMWQMGCASAEARRACRLPLGAVFDTFAQSRTEVLAALRPEYVFTDVYGLPFSGPLTVPGAEVAVYEVADAPLARVLAARGVNYIETFDYAEMASALGPATLSLGEATT